MWERPQDVQPPDRERPREGDGLRTLGRLMDLLRVELAGFARLDELRGVLERGGSIETVAEGLPDEGSRRGVVAIVSTMDVGEELTAYFGVDAQQTNPVGPLAVQLLVLAAVELGLASNALSFYLIVR